MREQNYKNHARFITLYHRILPSLILVTLIGGIINLVQSSEGNLYSASLIVSIVLIICVFYWYIRSFPLKAQDRAIRAEENLRHFILTGTPLDSRLTLSQITALRFASDEEFIPLSQRAVNENLSGRAIKKQIKNWRPDWERV